VAAPAHRPPGAGGTDAAGNIQYYQRDQYGSTRLLTDGTGSVSATFTFDPYGNLTAKTGTADTPLRWNGQAQDSDTGLYYLRARYYDPVMAQFLSVDPLASVTRVIYTYAENNPLNKTDPLGLFATPFNLFDEASSPSSVDCAGTENRRTSSMSTIGDSGWCSNYNVCSPPLAEGCYSWNACGAAPKGDNPRLRCVYGVMGQAAIGGALGGAAKVGLARFIPILGQAVFGSCVVLGAAGGLVSGAYFGFTVACPAPEA